MGIMVFKVWVILVATSVFYLLRSLHYIDSEVYGVFGLKCIAWNYDHCTQFIYFLKVMAQNLLIFSLNHTCSNNCTSILISFTSQETKLHLLDLSEPCLMSTGIRLWVLQFDGHITSSVLSSNGQGLHVIAYSHYVPHADTRIRRYNLITANIMNCKLPTRPSLGYQ